MPTLSSVIKEFLLHCKIEKKLSDKTLKAYQTDLNQLYSFMESKKYDMDIIKISKIELREYLVCITDLKPKSIKRKIATIKALFNYLEYEDTITINPFRKMRISIKEPKRLPNSNGSSCHSGIGYASVIGISFSYDELPCFSKEEEARLNYSN